MILDTRFMTVITKGFCRTLTTKRLCRFNNNEGKFLDLTFSSSLIITVNFSEVTKDDQYGFSIPIYRDVIAKVAQGKIRSSSYGLQTTPSS